MLDTSEFLQVFVRVAELGSFTKAADSLGMSKASVSVAISQLEASVGTRLLQRTTRKVQMTQDGHSFYERSKQVLADIEDLRGMFQGEAEISGRLRVDMPLGVARHIVLPKLAAFLEAHPQIKVELSSTDRRVDVVAEGFDCIVRVGKLDDSSLVARPLGNFRLVNCASPAYLARYGVPRSLDDLAAHRLVDYAPSLGAQAALFEYVDGDVVRSVEMPAAVAVNNSDAYQGACLAGLGIIQAPESGLGELLANGRLVEVLPGYRAAPMPVTLLYPNRRQLAKRARLFMLWLGEVMQPWVL
ncbi:LysR family transcriptional regulator [Massilia soli]|uniref:LysR family transcriptional regulator n=1 Tax=Massilia soli TaxID=2792854 RepID=A0ABS7SI47_9BURK|nr:LysR family transcriptional regulator [Massilia soli]MBZ2205882.1 LysR family transcriptional regulator [Massilia soli]